jgi:hypothetical protein
VAIEQDHPEAELADPSSGSVPLANERDKSNEPPVNQSERAYPRIVEEHHIVGPRGEDEVEATDDRGRRWYHLRPQPRGRADLIGFNYTWWLFAIVIVVIALLPW